MPRLLVRAATLSAIALATTGCASLGLDSADSAPAPAVKPVAADTASDATTASDTPTSYADMINKLPDTLDGEIRRAQLLRAQGDFNGAVRALSQLMLVAPDDPRVVGEYGKVLTQQGRSNDALAFLNRAIELQPDNWTLYSALGVAYDQKGQRDKAEDAYKHALTLKPDEPTVLNNYAMSQMMAGHLDHAEALLHQAAAHGGDYPKIAGNLQMIAAMRAKRDLPAEPQSGLRPATDVARAATPLPAMSKTVVSKTAETGAPRALVHKKAAPVPQAMPQDVVMQKLPHDPLAGKVYGHHAAADAHVAETKETATKAAAKAPEQKLAQADTKADAKPQAHAAEPTAPALRTANDLY